MVWSQAAAGRLIKIPMWKLVQLERRNSDPDQNLWHVGYVESTMEHPFECRHDLDDMTEGNRHAMSTIMLQWSVVLELGAESVRVWDIGENQSNEEESRGRQSSPWYPPYSLA